MKRAHVMAKGKYNFFFMGAVRYPYIWFMLIGILVKKLKIDRKVLRVIRRSENNLSIIFFN